MADEQAGDRDEVLPELAYYFPEPFWPAHESSWVKSLLLFFDGVAILLPDYMTGREIAADPSLAEPLEDLGLLKVLQPEWFVDDEMADRLAEGMVELITNDAFIPTGDFAALSRSRAGFASLSMSRMGSRDQGVFDMIYDDLKQRGLARDSEDGVSIPMDRTVRMAYLMLLAQEAREAGRRQGFDLHPATNSGGSANAFRRFLELTPMPSRQDIVQFDLSVLSLDLEAVPLDEVLDFRGRYRNDHRGYMLDLRRFSAELALVEPADRGRLLDHRRAELEERASGLLRLARGAFGTPKGATDFSLGLLGAAWGVHMHDPVDIGLGLLGAGLKLIPGRETGNAYSYVFRAHGMWS